MWSNLKWTGVVAAAIVVAACDRTPVEPVPQVESPGDALGWCWHRGRRRPTSRP